MRKHFLILMLFALLPFTGKAANFSTEATATSNDIYFGLELTTAEINLQVNGIRITDIKLDKTTGGDVIFYTNEFFTAKATIPTGSKTPVPGENYYVKVLPSTDANTGEKACKVIVKAMPMTVTVAAASKTFNNKGKEDTAETLGEISAISILKWKTNHSEGFQEDNLSSTALTNMAALLDVDRVDGKTAKSYKYDVKFKTANNNYVITTSDAYKFTINKRTLPSTVGEGAGKITVTVDDNEKVYNGSNQKATVTIVDNDLNYTLAASDFTVKYGGDENVKDANAAGYEISFTSKGNYDGATTVTLDGPTDKKLIVAQKPLTIIVDDVTKAYDGTADIPATTLTYSGLVGDDVYEEAPFGESFIIDYAVSTGDKYYVSKYPLKARKKVLADFSGATNPSDALAAYEAALAATTYSNYKVTFSEIGQLTVDRRKVTIKADDKDKFFGDADPGFTFVVATPASAYDNTGATSTSVITSGVKTDLELLTGLYSVVRSDAGNDDVKKHEGVLVLQLKAVADQSDAEKKVLLQYNPELKAGDFTVKTAALTVTPKKLTKTYGDDYDMDDFEVIATNNSGQRVTLEAPLPTVEFVEAAYNTEDGKPVDAGVYITKVVGTINATGYDGAHAIHNEGQLVIKQKELTAVLNDQILMVGDDKTALLKDNVVFAVDPAHPANGLKDGDVIKFALDFNAETTATPGSGKLLEQETTGDISTQAAADEWNGDVTSTTPNVTGALLWKAHTWTVSSTISAEDAAAYNAAIHPESAVTTTTPVSPEMIAAAKAYNETLTGAHHRELLKATTEPFTKGVKILVPETAEGFANKNYVITFDASFGKLTVVSNTQLVLTGTDVDLTNIKKLKGKNVPVSIDFAKRNARVLGKDKDGNDVVRNWAAGEWNTLVLPFDITVAELSQTLGYAIVNVIDGSKTVVDGRSSKFYGKLTMKGGNGYRAGEADADTKLAANKPFFVKTADDMTVTKNFIGNKTIVEPTDLTVDAGGNGCQFVGTYTTKTVTKADNEKIWFELGNWKEWGYIRSDSESTWNVLPTEAYIQIPATSTVSEITFILEELDGSTTAISNISADNATGKLNAEGWYTLNGVKLQSMPTQKGIYINNGKKVVIK